MIKLNVTRLFRYPSKLTEKSLISFSGSNVTRKCYGNLGCLEITEDWYGMTRPVNVLPQDRKEVNTQFFLRTREKPQGVGGSSYLLESEL